MDSRTRSPLLVLFVTVFLDLLGFGMIIPILPLYAEKLHARDFEIGILTSIYSVMQLFFSPILGRISDRAGRRPVLLISILGSCVSQFGYAFAPSFWWLVMARGAAGICGANVTAAQAYIADCTDEKDRTAGMGMLGAAFGLGFVFGPAVGGMLSHYSPTLPFLVSGGLAACNFLSALVILREPRSAAERTHARTLTWEGLVRSVTTPRLLALIVLFFVVTFGFANLESTFSLYLSRRFGFARRDTSFTFVYIGAIMILVQGGLVRRLAPRVGERTLILWGTLLMAGAFGVLWLTDDKTILFLAIAVMAIGNGLNTPALSSLISRSATKSEQGGVLGVSQSAGALARVAGPMMGTSLLALGVAIPYLAGGIAMLAGCLFAALAVRQPESRRNSPKE